MDSLLDISKTIATEIFTGKEHPRDVLPDIKEFIMKFGAQMTCGKARAAKVMDCH